MISCGRGRVCIPVFHCRRRRTIPRAVGYRLEGNGLIRYVSALLRECCSGKGACIFGIGGGFTHARGCCRLASRQLRSRLPLGLLFASSSGSLSIKRVVAYGIGRVAPSHLRLRLRSTRPSLIRFCTVRTVFPLSSSSGLESLFSGIFAVPFVRHINALCTSHSNH